MTCAHYDSFGRCLRYAGPVSAFNHPDSGAGYGEGYFFVALLAFFLGVIALQRYVLPWAFGTVDNRTGKLLSAGSYFGMIWGAAIAARFIVTHDHHGADWLLSIHEGHRDVVTLLTWGAQQIAAWV